MVSIYKCFEGISQTRKETARGLSTNSNSSSSQRVQHTQRVPLTLIYAPEQGTGTGAWPHDSYQRGWFRCLVVSIILGYSGVVIFFIIDITISRSATLGYLSDLVLYLWWIPMSALTIIVFLAATFVCCESVTKLRKSSGRCPNVGAYHQ